MRLLPAAAVSALGLLLLASTGWAQGLGDVAAQERARREKQGAAGRKAPVRSFANEDLPAADPAKKASGGEAEAAATPGPDTAPGEGSSTPSAQDVMRDRAARVAAAQEELATRKASVAALEGRVQVLQGKLNPMSTTFIYGAGGSNDASEELRVREELTSVEGQLAEARSAAAAAEQAVEDARLGRDPSPGS